MKRGLKDNTFQNYQYMYGMFVAPTFGKKRISEIVKSDVKRFYNTLVDERGLSVSTVDSIHTVLHQVLDMAVDDCYIRHNPSDSVLKELKQTHAKAEKRRALTQEDTPKTTNGVRKIPMLNFVREAFLEEAQIEVRTMKPYAAYTKIYAKPQFLRTRGRRKQVVTGDLPVTYRGI